MKPLTAPQVRAMFQAKDTARAMEQAMSPRPDPVHPMFRDHNCAGCSDGEKPCRNGNPRNCEWPRARND